MEYQTLKPKKQNGLKACLMSMALVVLAAAVVAAGFSLNAINPLDSPTASELVNSDDVNTGSEVTARSPVLAHDEPLPSKQVEYAPAPRPAGDSSEEPMPITPPRPVAPQAPSISTAEQAVQFIHELDISAVSSAKAIIDGKSYRWGEFIEPTNTIRLVGIDGRELIFEALNKRYWRSF